MTKGQQYIASILHNVYQMVKVLLVLTTKVALVVYQTGTVMSLDIHTTLTPMVRTCEPGQLGLRIIQQQAHTLLISHLENQKEMIALDTVPQDLCGIGDTMINTVVQLDRE
jgi:hypothetical protein